MFSCPPASPWAALAGSISPTLNRMKTESATPSPSRALGLFVCVTPCPLPQLFPQLSSAAGDKCVVLHFRPPRGRQGFVCWVGEAGRGQKAAEGGSGGHAAPPGEPQSRGHGQRRSSLLPGQTRTNPGSLLRKFPSAWLMLFGWKPLSFPRLSHFMVCWGSFLGFWGDFGAGMSRGRSPSVPHELRAPLNQALGVSPQKNNSACELPAPVPGVEDPR